MEDSVRWNSIPGLTLQEQNWMDELAHGLVTPEALAWVCRLAAGRSGRTPEQLEHMARNLLDEMALPQELGRVRMIADILKIWFGSQLEAPTELKEEDLSESTTDWLKRTGIKSAEPTAPTEEHDKHSSHGFIQDVDGDACVRCGRLEKSPIHHTELIGHVVQQGGKCWCGETHEAY